MGQLIYRNSISLVQLNNKWGFCLKDCIVIQTTHTFLCLLRSTHFSTALKWEAICCHCVVGRKKLLFQFPGIELEGYLVITFSQLQYNFLSFLHILLLSVHVQAHTCFQTCVPGIHFPTLQHECQQNAKQMDQQLPMLSSGQLWQVSLLSPFLAWQKYLPLFRTACSPCHASFPLLHYRLNVIYSISSLLTLQVSGTNNISKLVRFKFIYHAY